MMGRRDGGTEVWSCNLPVNHHVTSSMSALPSLNVSPKERGLGALVHLLGIVGPIWLPLAAWAVFKPFSAYVSAHAWREFRDAIIWKGFLLIVMVVSLSLSLARIVHHFQTGWQEFSWQEVAIRAVISLVVFCALWTWNLVQAVLAARAAWKGRWPKGTHRDRTSELKRG